MTELKVIGQNGDHDVVLIDKKKHVWIMSVENAYDSAFCIGTVIFIKN